MPISIRQRLVDAGLSRLLKTSGALNGYAVEQVRTPMRDGVVLLGDHFAPETGAPRGTVLIRTPYGRGFPTSALNGRLFAARGYHVVSQSVRGTFGSGGAFQPMAQETEDGQDTVAWLREQSWFDGRLATLGGSYLGWTQWTLMQDPPPELRTAVVYVGPHDFRRAVFGTGAFTLGDFLAWSDQIAHQEDGSLRRVLSMASSRRRLREALGGLPLPDAAEPVLQGRAPWYREWLAHPDDGPWWDAYRATAALTRVEVPVLLVSGWQDLFLEQSLEQYEVLRDRGVDVALTVGPWTHFQVSLQGAAMVSRESVAWLDQHMADGPPARKAPVHVYRTGEGRWHELASWPPAAAPAEFRLHADRTLTTATTQPAMAHAVPAQRSPAELTPATAPAQPTSTNPALLAPHDAASTQPTSANPAQLAPHDAGSTQLGAEAPLGGDPSGMSTTAADAQSAEMAHGEAPGGADLPAAPGPSAAAGGTVSFRYDPSDPTPGLGGRTLNGSTGIKDNRGLETRPDVVTFTTDPLPTAVDVIGSPTLELAVAVDEPHADVFIRLCDVDERGRSRNFSDMHQRLDPAVPAGEVQRLSLALDPCFHRLPAGHRLRLQVSGGAFPRFARNLGAPGTPAEGRTLRPSVHTIHCAGSRLILPVAATDRE